MDNEPNQERIGNTDGPSVRCSSRHTVTIWTGSPEPAERQFGVEFNWTDTDYANIVMVFQLVYAISMLFAGRIHRLAGH